ncbi:MAG: zinc-finger domain-containing protein, partial [Rhodospirillaceae bacterium]|nr:zinc-finger domain-containing protein [Rhodospirillaceae bacterium]
MEPIETEIVTKTRIACEGGGGPSGHPRVYLNLGKDGHVDCPYC